MEFGLAILLFVSASFVDAKVFHFDQNEILKPLENDGVHWALLVAGSNGWYNYRHQADVCHAYQILKKHGLPDERIVVMMYDDIAYNEENPTPGIIINHPNGSDVYHGVPKDYTKETVTPRNFLKILQGESMEGIGSGKVIKSGPNDHVFVNFVDHGAPGIVAFPAGELTARQLNNAIQKMNQAQKYKQMVLYVEACESGSMFKKLLPKNINVYATTAANAHESSYACYLDETRNTYLGDVYSVKWMEDSDKEDLNKETLHTQYEITKQETNTSHVQQYGDMKVIAKESVSNFQGRAETTPIILPDAPLNAVPSEDVPLAIATHKLNKARNDDERQRAADELNRLIQEREAIERSMLGIVTMATDDENLAISLHSSTFDLENFECYESAMRHYDTYCYDLSKYDYALRHMYNLVNLCEHGIQTDRILSAIYNVCTQQ